MAARRLATIPLYLLATLALTAAIPLLLPLTLLLALLPPFRGAPSTLLFLAAYLWCETLGMAAAAYLWVRHRRREPFLKVNYRLQCWWANALKVAAERLFRLHFEVLGSEALRGPPALMLPRHASIADTVIPMVFYAIPAGIRLRYVLKRELLLDPCLDIVGNRLPNVFVDRSGLDSERARRGVHALVASLGPTEGALLYPEGTRFSAAKHAALRARYGDRPHMTDQLERWQHLLPPRLGGVLAMLDANPGRDLIFCAHVGFEGASHFRHLVNGSWIGARVRIRFWRVPYADIPASEAERSEFVFAQWDRMDREVTQLS